MAVEFASMLKSKYGIDLSKEQEIAIQSIDGPCLLLAVPGSGKTTVIVSRCFNMILNHNISPDKILTITFSKSSALDMAKRFSKVFGQEIGLDLKFSTIHSFCYDVVDRYVKTNNRKFPKLLQDDAKGVERKTILRNIYESLNNEDINDDRIERLSNQISFVKNMLLTNEQIESFETGFFNFPKIFEAYEDYKCREKCIDYDDLLTGTYRLFLINQDILDYFRKKYHYINVDESQDTSLVQHEIIRLLANPRDNLFMVGDEDQSIYGFRAASPKCMLSFDTMYDNSKRLFMQKNFRSTKTIVSFANGFIKNNEQRFEKQMFTDNEKGEDVCFKTLKNRQDVFAYLADKLSKINDLSSYAIIYRNNVSLISMINLLEEKKVPFYTRESKNKFFEHAVLKDVQSYISFSNDFHDIESFERIYKILSSFFTKNFFKEIAKKVTPDLDVFEVVRLEKSFSKKTKDIMEDLREDFIKFRKLKPKDIFAFIQNELRYEKYIDRITLRSIYYKRNIDVFFDTLRAISLKTSSFEEYLDRLNLLENLIESSTNNKNENAVTLCTVHSCKGLEFDNVYIVDLAEGIFPTVSIDRKNATKKNLMDIEEECRLFYVAITRAKKYLELLTYKRANFKVFKKSSFVKRWG